MRGKAVGKARTAPPRVAVAPATIGSPCTSPRALPETKKRPGSGASAIGHRPWLAPRAVPGVQVGPGLQPAPHTFAGRTSGPWQRLQRAHTHGCLPLTHRHQFKLWRRPATGAGPAMEEGHTGVRLAEREEGGGYGLPDYETWMPADTGVRDFATTVIVQEPASPSPTPAPRGESAFDQPAKQAAEAQLLFDAACHIAALFWPMVWVVNPSTACLALWPAQSAPHTGQPAD